MKKVFLSALLVFGSSLAWAGTKLLNPTNAPHSTSLPSTCSQGDMYQDSDATSGQQWYLCESANNWVLQGDGGGGGGGAPTNATYITQTPDASLSAEQALSSLSDGLLKHASGVVSRAAPDTDYTTPTSTGSYLTLQRIGNSDYSTIQDFANLSMSAGRISGGLITDAGSSKVNISSGSGFVKALDADSTTNYFFVWPSSSAIPIASNTVEFIGVKYNAGSPVVSTKATNTFDLDTEFLLGLVVNEAGKLYISSIPWITADNQTNIIERFDSLAAVSRDNRTGGLVLSNTGTRNVAVTAGTLLARMSEFSVSAIDTSASSTFDAYYRDGVGGWTKQSAATQWNNTNYDDGDGTLGSITALSYSSRWFYLMIDGSLAMLYGQNNSSTLAAALNDGTPSSVPDRILYGGLLIGRFIIQASGSTPSVTQSAFGTAFTAAAVTNFSDLAGTADISSQTNLAVSGPITLTGDTVGSTLISLSTGITGTLSATNMVSTAAFITSSQTVSGNTTFTSTSVYTNGFLRLPSGANPALNTVGDIAIDTTAGQLTVHDGTNVVVWSATGTKTLTLESPVLSDFPIFWRASQDQTIQSINCISSASTSTGVRVQECDANAANCVDIEAAITCTTSNTAVLGAQIDNNSIDAGDWVRVLISAVSGTPGWVSVTVGYTETRK